MRARGFRLTDTTRTGDVSTPARSARRRNDLGRWASSTSVNEFGKQNSHAAITTGSQSNVVFAADIFDGSARRTPLACNVASDFPHGK